MVKQMENQLPEIYCKSLYKDVFKPHRFEITQEIEVVLTNGEKLIIPIGYKTDFASVPRTLWGIIQTSGRHNLATVIHDWLYDNRLYNRKFADKEMLYWLLISGCSKVKAYTMYYACRIGGKKWWVN